MLNNQLLLNCLSDAIAYNPADKRNNIIRRTAFYYKLIAGKKIIKKYYDDPAYPRWHGGYISCGHKDLFGTYMLIEKLVWSDKDQAKALQAIRTLLKRQSNANNQTTIHKTN